MGLLPIVVVAIYYAIVGFQQVVNANQFYDVKYSDVGLQMFLELFSMPGYRFLTNDIWIPLIIVFLFFIIILYAYFKIDYKNNEKILIPFFSLSLLLLVLSNILFSEILVNLWIPRGWVALVVFTTFTIAVGWSYLENFLSKWLSKRVLMFIFLLLFFVIGIFQYGVRYELWDYGDYSNCIYPFPNQQVITTLVETVELHIDESTQLITFPFYEMIIFEYEWRNRQFANDYRRINYAFFSIDQELETNSDIFNLFIRSLDQSVNKPLKLIIIMNQYAAYNLLKNNDPFSKARFKLFNFINSNCETKWSEEVMRSYYVWGCELAEYKR